jgi:membrane protein implicated in regulation of membrane protease activity
VNEFIAFGSMAIGSFASGALLDSFAWSVICSMILAPVLIAILALLWLRFLHKPVAKPLTAD